MQMQLLHIKRQAFYEHNFVGKLLLPPHFIDEASASQGDG